MTSAFSWQNSISLCLLNSVPKAKFACYSRCFLTSYFCIPVPYNEEDIFFWVLVLKHLVGLHRTIQIQHLQHYCLRDILDFHDSEWFALETEIILLFLRLHPSTAFWIQPVLLKFKKITVFVFRNKKSEQLRVLKNSPIFQV